MQNTVGFVSKVLVPGTNVSTAKRKVRRALGSVSTLLCIHDDCLHSIHKSFKDWLTETSCYGEYEFIMDEIERQRILAVRPLYWGTKRSKMERCKQCKCIGVKREALELERLAKSHIVDLEIVYAKNCINSTVTVEDLVFGFESRWLH